MARRARGTRARSTQDHWTVEDARQLLEAWDRSGLTMAAFCRMRGIRPKRLYWWRSRLAAWSQDPELAEEVKSGAESGHHLVQAVIVPTSATPSTVAVTLHLRSGDTIDVLSPEHVAAGWLVCLVRGLSASVAGSAQ